MVTLRLKYPQSVLAATREFDELGRDVFLRRYGFGRARECFLFLDGLYYDSKAVCGAAFRFENPDLGALGPGDFSGGEATVAHQLESLGFTVVRSGGVDLAARLPLVLVENEATYGGQYDHWLDQTGVQYQYPNQYRGRIRPGRPFVYYRGVRRAGGGRGEAEYFGAGRIGAVWRDESVPETVPKNRWKWYCQIEDYRSFQSPVPAKYEGRYFEDISHSMGWRTAVRELSQEVFDRILALGGADGAVQRGEAEITTQLTLPPAREVQAAFSDDYRVIVRQVDRPRSRVESTALLARRSRSRQSIAIGDHAEEIVYRWLRTYLPEAERESVDWLAQRGETPGWDIQYLKANGQLIAVEVKGTVLSRFTDIELTANEWAAAERLGVNYWLYLVAKCSTTSPIIAPIQDPYRKCSEGNFQAVPAAWRLMLS